MKVSVHPILNRACGVIRCYDLASVADINVGDELKDQEITAVKPTRIKSNDQEKDTNLFFLTFCSTDLPRDICIRYLQLKVDPFVSSPLCCFKCQKYEMQFGSNVP